MNIINPRKIFYAPEVDFFEKTINVDYPPGNRPIFEEWMKSQYFSVLTDRNYLPILWTSFHVNNKYGTDKNAIKRVQDFIDGLNTNEKFYTVCQYDDGVLVDLSRIDIINFNMSKKVGIEMPLLCQPQPYKFTTQKKWLANFVGSKTHSLRESANIIKNNPDYYISFDHHNIETYCRILHESVFTLCYRGYGANSFRISESMQYGSIPVYISDEFIKPFDANFEDYGVMINENDAARIGEILESISHNEIISKQEKLHHYYNEYYTYEGALKQIIKYLEAEYHNRQEA